MCVDLVRTNASALTSFDRVCVPLPTCHAVRFEMQPLLHAKGRQRSNVRIDRSPDTHALNGQLRPWVHSTRGLTMVDAGQQKVGWSTNAKAGRSDNGW